MGLTSYEMLLHLSQYKINERGDTAYRDLPLQYGYFMLAQITQPELVDSGINPLSKHNLRKVSEMVKPDATFTG